MNSNIIYQPLTAVPFRHNLTYKEILPDMALQPYIRCFWGSEKPYIQTEENASPEIVVPDTCVDIVYQIDYTDNVVSGSFFGINDRSFFACMNGKSGHLMATFAIRFYAWNAYLFSDDSFRGTANGCYEVGERFGWLDKALGDKLFEKKTLAEKITYVQQLFIKKMDGLKRQEIVNHAISNMLIHRGSLEISHLARDAFVSSRHLERLFHEYVGITPKKMSNLIRYQFLWRDILFHPNFDILDAMYKFGFTDQAHLMREFKRYHSMNIRKARELALHCVENIQEKPVYF